MAKFQNVLLVEDDPITIMVCERIITMIDFAHHIKSLANGEDAINHIKTLITTDQDIPEIIFLDINMPIMNGWEFLENFEKIKDDMRSVPRIFILSSTVDPEDFKKAQAYSAVESFISKPLTKEHLQRITEAKA